MAFGKPAITTPNRLEMRPVQEAVRNTRQRIEALEAAVTVLQNTGSAANAQAIAVLQAQVAALRDGGSGTGSVTSVGATVPDFMNVSGSPITSSGTLAFSFIDQPTGYVLAGPVSGADDVPTFRPLQWNYDLPLITSASFISGLDGGEAVLLEQYGNFVWCTVQDIVNLGPGSGGAWSIVFNPVNNEPPVSNYATLDTRNAHPTLDFDATTQEAGVFSSVFPFSYAGGGVTVHVYFVAVATSGTVGWDVAFERMDSSTDIDSDSFAAAQTITAVTVPSTSGQVVHVSVDISAGSNMDNIAAGDAFRIRVRRDVASDTASGDAELLRVVIVEQ